MGVALALLFAPQSGTEVRGLISRKVNDSKAWVKDKATEAADKVQAQGTALRDGIKETAGAIARS